MEADVTKESLTSTTDGSQSDHRISSSEKEQEGVSSDCQNASKDSGTELGVMHKKETRALGQELKSHEDSTDVQKESSKDSDIMVVDASDANNSSNETFCSDASSSVMVDESKDVQVISESEGEDEPSVRPEDARSSDEPKSPGDMFASQPPDDPVGTQDTQDCDVIPSSQSLDSHSHSTEAETLKSDQREGSCSPLTRKRKLDAADEVEKKLPRIDEENPEAVSSISESLTVKCTTIGESKEVIDITDRKNSQTDEGSTKVITSSEKSGSEVEKSLSEPELHSQGYGKHIGSESIDCSSLRKSDKPNFPRRQGRESLEIVYMSPKVSCSQDSLNIDTQISPLQDDDRQIKHIGGLPTIDVNRSCGDEEEKDFHLHLPTQISQKQTNFRKKLDSESSSSIKSSGRSKSGESTLNSHNSVIYSEKYEKRSNADVKSSVENGVHTSTEVLTIDEDEDNDLQILPQKPTKSESKKDDVSSSTNLSSVPGEGSSTSNDIAVIQECKSNSNGSLVKSGVSTSNGSVSQSDVSSFSRHKEQNLGSNVHQLHSSIEQVSSVKRKRDSPKNCDVQIESDSESEDPSELTAKKSREIRTPDDVTHLKQLAKDNFVDTKEQSVESEKKIYFECRVKLKYNSQNQEILSWEVSQWGDITDDLIANSSRAVQDVSPGILGDVSKSSSPSSVTSCGLFPLQPRHRISTSTSSSGRTSSTGYSGVSRNRSSLESVQFIKPTARSLKDKSFSLESSLGKSSYSQAGRLKEHDLCEKIERRLQLSISSDGEMKDELPDIILTNRLTEVDKEKISRNELVSFVPEDDKAQISERKKSTISAGEKNGESLALDTTPKSTQKPRGRTRTRKPPKSGETTITEQLKGGASKNQVNRNNEGNTPQRRGRASKKSETISKKTGVGDTKSVSSDTPKQNKKSTAVSEEIAPSESKGDGNDQDDSSDTGSSCESDVTLDWNVESCKTKLAPGARAFARWTDKRYYSAKVKEYVKDDRWIIEFDDGNTKTLKEELIIPVNILTKGQIVFAPVGEDFDEGRIKKFKMKHDEIKYGIELEGGEIVYVPPSKLFMTEDQARILQEDVAPKVVPSTPKSTSVSVDNIVEGKRSRSNRAVLRVVEGPGVSGTARVASKRPSRSDPGHDTSRSSSVSDATDKESTSAFEEVGGVDPEAYNSPECTFSLSNRGKGPGRIKGKGRSTPRKRASSNQSNSEECSQLVEALGPIPQEGSNIFSGMHFLLTYAGSSGDTMEYNWETSDDTGDEDKSCKFKFVKGHLKSQLEAGGGTVYEHFKDVPSQVYSTCYLIADRPTETAKYILCLASGIKIVRFDWVIHKCMGRNYDLNGIMLPAGYSLESRRLVSFDLKARKKKPLNLMKVGLVNDSKHFLEFWDRVLVALGAKVWKISSERDKEFKSVKVIVTDSSCPPEVQDRAREWNIPMVSTTWVKQCLIRWEFRPYDGHQYYRYDYCPLD